MEEQWDHKINPRSYDLIADHWKEARDNIKIVKPILDWLALLPNQSRILDLGCGTGYPVAKLLTTNGHFITGIDSSPQMIMHAQKLALNTATFQCADIVEFKPNHLFEGIIAWDSLFHLAKTDQDLIYQKIASWLAPGGYFLFTHGDTDGEHIDYMMGQPFYYSAIPFAKIEKIMVNLDMHILSSLHDYRENDTHISLVVLAQKNK